MSEKKMIIRNCPAYQKELVTMDFKTGETIITDKNYCINPFLPNACQDCTDCLMKNIVELCKDYYKNCKIEGNCIDDRTCTSCFFGGGNELAQDILSNLDIEECDDE